MARAGGDGDRAASPPTVDLSGSLCAAEAWPLARQWRHGVEMPEDVADRAVADGTHLPSRA